MNKDTRFSSNLGTNDETETNKIKSTLISRNVTILGHRTSVRLEPEMWTALREISGREDCTIHEICSLIHLSKNKNTSLTAAIRVFLMLYYRASSTEEGHIKAGHGNFESMKNRVSVHSDLRCEIGSEPKSFTKGMTQISQKCSPRLISTRDELIARSHSSAMA